MPILNFKEIPPTVKLASGYTDDHTPARFDDFEKFTQDFFSTFYDAEILEPVSRGPDGGRDLVINVVFEGKDEKWLVSCKHTAHGENAVNGEEESNLMNRFHRVKNCTRFVGFYSHIPTTDLIKTLEDFETNFEGFKFKIFNNVEIERVLLSADDGRGWFFACRHFPISFSRLFSRFLMPIQHYKTADVKNMGKRALALRGPGGGETSYDGSKEDRKEKSDNLVRFGNEAVTSAVHEAMFARTMLDISRKWPGCFRWWSLDDPDEINVGSIMPTFDVNALLTVGKKEGHSAVRLLTSLWSWWNFEKAAGVFSTAWKLLGKETNESLTLMLINPLHAEQICDIEERDLLTRFVAFAQGSRLGMPEFDRVISIATHLKLCAAIDTLITNSSELLDPAARERVVKCADPSERLGLLAYYLGADELRTNLRELDDRLAQDFYESFEKLVEQGIQWNVVPGSNLEWFSDVLLPKK